MNAAIYMVRDFNSPAVWTAKLRKFARIAILCSKVFAAVVHFNTALT